MKQKHNAMVRGITYTAPNSIDIPRNTGSLAVRRFDWNRLKKMALNLPKERKWLFGFASTFAGFSGSAWLTLITLVWVPNRPSWVIPTCISFAVATLILSVVLFVIDWSLQKNKNVVASNMCEEMDEIEKMFKHS